MYFMHEYSINLFNAICSENALGYTSFGINYILSKNEDSVRIYNTLFDTVFYEDFSLAKLPIDSMLGFNFISTDTFFCPAESLNSYNDILSREIILNWYFEE